MKSLLLNKHLLHLMLVTVPKDAYQFEIVGGILLAQTKDMFKPLAFDLFSIDSFQVEKDYEIIGKLSEILTDESKCAELVESYSHKVGWSVDENYRLPEITLYKNYDIEIPQPVSMLKGTAKESLLSRLKAEGVLIDKPKKISKGNLNGKFVYDSNEYQQQLENYFNPETTLILKLK